MTITHSAIPTTYKGVRFRSRLEAKWAAFFDAVDWPWEYEPIDLGGYIPDFVLPFTPAPILVEVKPLIFTATGPDPDAWIPIRNRVDACPWRDEALIVGANIFAYDPIGNSMQGAGGAIGWLREYCGDDERWGAWQRSTCWAAAVPFECSTCNGIGQPGIGLRHEYNSYACRRCGVNDHTAADMWIEDLRSRYWATACNVTQWQGRGHDPAAGQP
jgi:hypothetical protein